jgi:hypothetical protein
MSSTEPPWSIAQSTTTDPGRIERTIASVTTTGARPRARAGGGEVGFGDGSFYREAVARQRRSTLVDLIDPAQPVEIAVEQDLGLHALRSGCVPPRCGADLDDPRQPHPVRRRAGRGTAVRARSATPRGAIRPASLIG